MFLSMKIVFISANNADPDEILPYAAFHMCLHCLLNSLFAEVPRIKRFKNLIIMIILNQLFSVMELPCLRNKLKYAKQSFLCFSITLETSCLIQLSILPTTCLLQNDVYSNRCNDLQYYRDM